jgi:hypothetical protein
MALSKITADSITANVISSAIIADGEITFADLANNTITGAKIASATITGDKIGLTAITSNLVAAAAITGDKIGLTAITGNLIASGVTITSPVLITPNIGTPSSGILSSCTVDGTNRVGYQNIPQSGSAKTSSYTLTTGDVGEFIQVSTSGEIVVPNATFATGDAVSIFNNTSAGITMTMSITTAYIGGTDADKATITLATRGVATILFISGTVCVVNGNVS